MAERSSTDDAALQAAESGERPDAGLRGVDYAGISPLTLPVEALLRAIKALSKLFWISMIGTLLTIFLASLANLGGAAQGSVSIGEYSIPVSVLPIGCLVFAWFMLWLTAARLRMLDGALADDDLTATLALEIFRLDPPVLDVFDVGNLRPFALLSGSSMLLWNWSLFFGSSVGLFFSAIVVPGAAASVNELGVFLVYVLASLAIMVHGGARILGPLRRILERLHGERPKLGLLRVAVAMAVLFGGILATNPDLPRVMTGGEYHLVDPSWANAIDGETLQLEQGVIVVLLGIEALRPDQTCNDAEGAVYPCGRMATTYLQSIVQDRPVRCLVYYGDQGACVPLNEGDPLPETLEDFFGENSLQARMVSAGLAFTEGVGVDIMGQYQDEAQRRRVGAWQGAFEPPSRWAAGPHDRS